ncbi:VOC family protein [Staphylococcus ureilyticus]|uniref:VOC family protein n=1 Tax=Staphylococcus ureilyticus TaxID=94138 RepID=UPI0029052092|nr:VOC family protein [Staphylococcus ureilyticus]MDU0461285.1 VOC family protein [Staphylococcus ureilyticus]
MEKLNQVMLYVDDQSKAVDFWKNTMGFAVLSEEALAEGYKAVEIAPNNEVETSISIMEKEFIKKYSPGVNLGTPSLMFKAFNFDELYTKLKDMGLTGHDIIEMSGTRVFNFQDGQGNYFAVSE